MNQYFMDNRQLTHNRKEIPFRFFGIDYKFITDKGVFSKDSVDYGTQILLQQALQSALGEEILDYGCGYGVVSVILAKNTKANIVGVDVNSRAVELSKENLALNKVKAEILLVDDNWQSDKQFSSILLNPPIRAGKEVIYKMFDYSCKMLEENGTLWIVIRKQHGANSALAKLKELFTNCTVVHKEKGYWIITAKNA